MLRAHVEALCITYSPLAWYRLASVPDLFSDNVVLQFAYCLSSTFLPPSSGLRIALPPKYIPLSTSLS